MNQEMLMFHLVESSAVKYMIFDKKKIWINDIYKTRDIDGEYVNLFKELSKQPIKFFEYFRLLPSTFEYIISRIHDKYYTCY